MTKSIAEVRTAFIHELQAFARDGYRFNKKHALREGTQREAFDAYLNGLLGNHSHGYVSIPTGVGKTAFYMALIRCYLKATQNEPDAPRILINVPTQQLVIQTAQAFAKFMPEIAPSLEADDEQGQQIDWENSDIGLQYHKVKHADRKPRVLITTYLSACRDTQNTTYPPKDYGLIVNDEGHLITGPHFGTVVDKFFESMQLAVTATPEYTPEKTVAKSLKHCYYFLSLKEAINRGDLCPPRPALIKTNYKIDEKKFQEFLKTQQGRPLNSQQLQALFNQEARNRAALETYFLRSDPDSHERYLGQNGAIYCGGIDHVDDVARLAARMLEEEAYAPVRKWLHDEHVELIAPVHGKRDGAWLMPGLLTDKQGNVVTKNRVRQNNKEWYSESEIFKLHERGKILLLASANKLKLGYDSPSDSVLFDLVDRFSKVEATQIDGRVFRLDPNNPHKYATVFNMVDQNTYELYQKNPKMMPIYCSEVIEGATVRKPKKRPHALSRFSKSPPELDQAIEQSGFELITDIDEVNKISQKYKKLRERALEKKTPPEGWLNLKEIQQTYAGSNQKKTESIYAVLDKKAEEGMSPEDIWAHWGGEYYQTDVSPPGFYVSPQTIAEAGLKRRDAHERRAPKNFIRLKTIQREYIGGPAIKPQLDAVLESKRKQGLSEEDITNNWGGEFEADSEGKGMPGIFVSEATIAEAKLRKLNEKNYPPEGAVSMLKVMGHRVINKKKIKDLIERKRAEGVSDEDIKRYWGGDYDSGHKPGFFATPRAIKEAGLKLKGQEDYAPKNWLTQKDLIRTYGDISALEELIQSIRANGMSEEEIKRDWCGKYDSRLGGPPGIFASPKAIKAAGLEPKRSHISPSEDAASSHLERAESSRKGRTKER